MKHALSILLPTYNCSCTEIVTELHRQCEAMGKDFRYEIIVADDASTERHFVEENGEIERLGSVRYLRREKNVGRANICNFLVGEAQYEWVLIIDGDLSIANPDLVNRYMAADGNAIVGGLRIGGTAAQWGHNLRWRYEKAYERTHNLAKRQKSGNRDLKTSNFLVRKSIIVAHPFNAQFRHYGYEDVLFGKSLADDHIAVTHIDNPVLFTDFEDNAAYLKKIDAAMQTLRCFSRLLEGYSPIIRMDAGIRRLHLAWLFRGAYHLLRRPLRRQLTGRHPSVGLMQLYKLLYFIALGA